MLAVFCLRLACGLVATLLLLSPAQVNPRFFRVHFLTALGLVAVVAVSLRDAADGWLWSALAAAPLLACLGSVVRQLDGAAGGRAVSGLAVPVLAAALALCARATRGAAAGAWLLAD